jgi:hypothetical protein
MEDEEDHMNTNIMRDVLERYDAARFSEAMYVLCPSDSHFGLRLIPLNTGMGGALIAYQLLRHVNDHFRDHFRMKFDRVHLYKSMHDLRGRDVFVYVGVKR